MMIWTHKSTWNGFRVCPSNPVTTLARLEQIHRCLLEPSSRHKTETSPSSFKSIWWTCEQTVAWLHIAEILVLVWRHSSADKCCCAHELLCQTWSNFQQRAEANANHRLVMPPAHRDKSHMVTSQNNPWAEATCVSAETERRPASSGLLYGNMANEANSQFVKAETLKRLGRAHTHLHACTHFLLFLPNQFWSGESRNHSFLFDSFDGVSHLCHAIPSLAPSRLPNNGFNVAEAKTNSSNILFVDMVAQELLVLIQMRCCN